MIAPRSRLLWFVGLLVLPLATVAGLARQALPWAAAAIALALLAAIADGWLARDALRGITIALPALVRMSRNREGSLDLRITHDGLRQRRLRVGLAFPREIESADDDTETQLPAAPVCLIACRCLPRKRGSYVLDTYYLETPSPLGFWAIRRATPARCEIRVYPDLIREGRRAGAQFLNREGVGIHRQRQVGRGREFEKLREYAPGDDYNEIHWKATAKRGHPVTKVFQVERTQEVYVIVDASRLTARPAGLDQENTDTILERFVTASLLFGLAAERQGDLFGLVTFSDRVHGFVRAKNGKAHYGTCQETLYNLHPRLVTPDFDELCSFLRLRLRRRALLVFLTELDDPVLAETFQRAMNVLRHQHLIMIGMLPPPEAKPLFSGAEPASVDDIYERLGGHFVWQGLRELEGALGRQGVRLSLLDADNLTAQLTSLYLNVKQRQLL
jgi:uncharacterized protein (DUF58 family)